MTKQLATTNKRLLDGRKKMEARVGELESGRAVSAGGGSAAVKGLRQELKAIKRQKVQLGLGLGFRV